MIKKFWDKFIDPLEFIRFKCAIVMVLMIAGFMLDRR